MMALAHPFPILERVASGDVRLPAAAGGGVIPAGTHVLIPLDEMGRAAAAAAAAAGAGARPPPELARLVFGVGPRACVGRHIALPLMVGLLGPMVAAGAPRFAPEVGHRWSGRHNDGATSVGEAAYQMAHFVRAMCAGK